MIQQWTARALVRGAEGASEEAAFASLSGCDPAVRWLVRRRISRQLLDAMTDVAATGRGVEDIPHVMRVARLALARRTVDAGNVAAVERSAAALPPPRPLRLPLVSFFAVTAVVAAAVFLVGAVTRSEARPAPYSRPKVPVRVGAYTEGGRPPTEPALDAFFTDTVTDAVIVLENQRGPRVSAARADAKARLLQPEILAVMGSPLDGEWRQFVDGLVAISELPQGGLTSETSGELMERAGSVSDHFAHRGLGYYLDVSIWSDSDGLPRAVPYAYRVEDVAYVQVGETRQRVLSLRRLDQLNRSKALLGMRSDHLSDPLVLLDRIERNIARDLVPMLAGTPSWEGKDMWHFSRTGQAMHAAIQSQVGEEIKAVLGDDRARLESMLALYVRREALWKGWRDELASKNVSLVTFTPVMYPDDAYDGLERWVVEHEIRRGRELEDQLARAEAPRLVAALEDLLVASVRRHEAQHAVDNRLLPYPAALLPLLGERDSTDRRAQQVASELSGYLSQLASDPKTPKATVAMLMSHVFHRTGWGSAESYAALAALTQLAKQLGIPDQIPLVEDGEINRDAAAALYTALLARPGADLRTAAAAAWSELFGAKYQPIVDELPAAGKAS